MYSVPCVRSSSAEASILAALANLLFLSAVGACLAGCATSGQLNAAAAFATSASTLGQGVKTAYTQAAQTEANLRTATYIVSKNASDITQYKYTTPLFGISPKDIPGRYAAANALTAYGQALTTLLDSKTQETNLATASGNFTAALKGIPATTLSQLRISSADITDVGNLITSLGDIYLDFRREQVLQQLVPKAAPIVNKLCSLFAQDFDTRSPMFGTIYSNAVNDVIWKTEDALTANAASLADRAILLPIYQQTASTRDQMVASFKSLNAAANSCVKTNTAFAKSVSDPTLSLTDILDFTAKAQAAYSAVMAAVAASK